MSPTQDPPQKRTNQERRHGSAKRPRRRPRLRKCLLKGCERRFRPKYPRSRYCGEDCRRKARRWLQWKAQKRYRATGLGKQQRRAQSCRHRERVRTRKPSKSTTDEAARVIKAKNYSTAPAIVRAAMTYSCEPVVRQGSDSVRGSAGARWSASWSGNGAGENAIGRSWTCRAFPGPFAHRDGRRLTNPPCS
jgi:ribosomal protein L35